MIFFYQLVITKFEEMKNKLTVNLMVCLFLDYEIFFSVLTLGIPFIEKPISGNLIME